MKYYPNVVGAPRRYSTRAGAEKIASRCDGKVVQHPDYPGCFAVECSAEKRSEKIREYREIGVITL